MRVKLFRFVLLLALAASLAIGASAASPNQVIGINVLLNTPITDTVLADLALHGRVSEVIYQLNAVALRAPASQLPVIQALPYVAAANPDAERTGAPVDTVPVSNFANGINTWNLDAVNVTNLGQGRITTFNGSGVIVAVLDSGLLDSWRQYFPQERIAVQYATSFGGGGAEQGAVSAQPNKWEHDQNSHGTHVTSTILGYSLRGVPINGVAPMATVIPVKVLNQTGSGWSSVIARGITYIADLKTGPLAGYPVVINMSLGGSRLDAVEKAAVDYAVARGVVIVAAAGNEGNAGMIYPAAYAPVISVAASGWVGEWGKLSSGAVNGSWWNNRNVADPTNPDDFYIADFSSRQKTGQDLDVTAPGTWVVGPYQVQSGKTSYYFLGGTSMATPHVSGVVALMMQKNPSLTASFVESILEISAIPLPAGCRNVGQPSGATLTYCWAADATGSGLVTADAALLNTP